MIDRSYFVMKRTDFNALLSFFSHLAFQRDPKPFSDLSLSEFPLVKRVKLKATYSILKSLLLEAKIDT